MTNSEKVEYKKYIIIPIAINTFTEYNYHLVTKLAPFLAGSLALYHQHLVINS